MPYLTEKLSKLRSSYSQRHRPVLSSHLSHTELRSSLRETHSVLSLPADTMMASSQGTQPSIAWYITFQIPVPTPHFTCFFSSFQITLWPIWLANSKRQPCTHKKTYRTDQKTDKSDGKPVLCQRTFSTVFQCNLFTQFNMECIGPFRSLGYKTSLRSVITDAMRRQTATQPTPS
jgi:hypothetical protein